MKKGAAGIILFIIIILVLAVGTFYIAHEIGLSKNQNNNLSSWGLRNSSNNLNNSNILVDGSNNSGTINSSSNNSFRFQGGGSDSNSNSNEIPTCTDTDWTFSLNPITCPESRNQIKSWSKIGQCIGGIDYNNSEIISCNPQEIICTSFNYSEWDICTQSGTQSRSILTSSPSGCSGGTPTVSQSCNYIPLCTENDWQYSLSSCSSSNQQTKSWTKIGSCSNGVSHPSSEIVSCVYQAPQCTYTYSSWGVCLSSNTQSRSVLTAYPANCAGSPVISQQCIYQVSSCSDGTSFGSCSLAKPAFCSANGQLVNNCLSCGCSSGSCQNDGSCVTSQVPSLTVTPMSNAIELTSTNIVSEDKCFYLDYTNSKGIRKLTYLNELPMIPWGTDKLHICLPKDISSSFKIKSTTQSNINQPISLGSSSEVWCSDFVTNVYNYPGLFAVAGSFTSDSLNIKTNLVGSSIKTSYTNSNPVALYRNTFYPAQSYSDSYSESDKRILLVFEKPDNYAGAYEINITQGIRQMWLAVPNWNCPAINEPTPEINVWTELRNDSVGTGKEKNDLENINWDLINSQKFKSDMQSLYNSGVNAITVFPQINHWSSCLTTVLPRYNQLTSALNAALSYGSFKFVLQPNAFLNVNYQTGEYFPLVLPAWDVVNGQWVSVQKNDKDAFKDLYACLTSNLKSNPLFKGIMPWQEATSRHYVKSIQTEVITVMKNAVSGSDKKVYGFDGWIEDNALTGNMETNYLVTDFGDIMVHQSFPAGGRVLPNGASAIQDSADGLRFWFRGLWRQGRTSPVNVMTYLQAFDKGDVSCSGVDTPTILSQYGFSNNWKMKNELDAQKAAIKFYSDKYNIPATFYGVMFYYYGNYWNNAGKDYIWSDENTLDKPTDCWPRMDNNQKIFDEVIDTAKYVRDQNRVNVA